MNDRQYIEAARRMAERLFAEGGSSQDDRLKYGFRLVVARPPTADELDVLRQVYESQLARYKANGEAAKQLLAVGDSPRNQTLDPVEHATWTMVCNLLLNLDELVMKE